MRYHVISLIAVFLALGIGILLGTTLVERGLIAEQKSEIESLQETFEEIREKNSSLHGELEIYKGFAAEARPYLIANRLNERPFAVITKLAPADGIVAVINESITAAGGNIPVGIILENPDIYDVPSVKDALSRLFQVSPEKDILMSSVFTEIANQLATASNPEMLAEFQRLGLIRVSGSLQGPVSGAVLVPDAGELSEDEIRETDVPLIQAFVTAGFPLVGGGGESTDEQVFVTYKNAGISTVDNVNTVPGQVALVMALEGRGGNYGTGSSADRLIPAPAEI